MSLFIFNFKIFNMPNDIKNNLTDSKFFLLYLKTVICFFFILVLIVASVNYKMDPEKVYTNFFKIIKSKELSSTDFTEKLIQSDNGIVMKNYIWNERDISYTLAGYPTDAECAIFGNSSATQISSFRQNKSLSKTCGSLINLAVSGGALEDYIAMTESIIQNKNPPKIIIISISPWTLNLNRDPRWLYYKKNFTTMLNKIIYNPNDVSKSFDKIESYNIKLIKNLLNLEYFMRSLELLTSKNDFAIELANEFNYNLGLEHVVLLPDGSTILSNEYITTSLKHKIDGISGNQNYKIIPGKWYSQNAIKILTKFVLYLKKNFKVVFIMIPSHPAVWNFDEQPVVTAMKIVEPKVHEIAKSLEIQVIGSFNPKKIGCTEEEFYDEMHPKDLCVSKLENVLLSY